MAEVLKFTCSLCSELHEGLPDWGCDAPDYYRGIPDAERERRGRLNADLCIVDDEHFFIRGVLLVPIIGVEQSFGWGVWTTLSECNFHRYCDLWEVDDMSGERPYFGWFSNQLPFYPDTRNLKVDVHLQPSGSRPLLRLQSADHPLVADQRDGISWERAVAFAERLLHGDFEYSKG